ncbi:putative glycoside hydrolase [Nguyenibacter sp. L1]|uniref:putative glycoside hydrolase n=1 Tax=Nguyenibacter sp. L1 TaxID=3049350 RepID=UPI002B4773CD|nr:putative glycoside hydrolase [Nguyenibacter sp. L1]WRH88894.1 putative glycoside hydrolase [Nguyenibacter sp. L1]
MSGMRHFRRPALVLALVLAPVLAPVFGSLAWGLPPAPGGRAAAVTLHVVDAATGRPVAGARIVLGDQEPDQVPDDQVLETDVSGRGVIARTDGRAFIRAPGYRAGTADIAALPSDGTMALTPFVPKALYLSSYGIGSAALRNRALALIGQSGLNALVIDVKGDRGLVPYPSRIPLAIADGARRMTTIPDLGALVRMLHARNLYAIARIVVFKDLPLASARPDLAVRLPDGRLFHDRQGMAWTDPSQPAVRQYNIAVAIEAAQAGFDEIQFDYIRFPDEAARGRFPDAASQAGRVAAVTAFLAEARRQLLPYNVYLATTIFGYVAWNRDDTGIGQQLERMAPLVDYLSPMLYPSGFTFGIPGVGAPTRHPYEIVYRSLEMARRRLDISPKRFRPWLQAFRDYAFDRIPFGPDEIAAQIRAATDFGSDGWMMWNPRNVYDALPASASMSATAPMPVIAAGR